MGEVVQAAVSIRPDAIHDQTEIITHCRRRLSRYKVPSTVFIVKELPTSANGKIMKQSLREQCQDISTLSRSNSTPFESLTGLSCSTKAAFSTHRRASMRHSVTPMNHGFAHIVLLGGHLLDAFAHAASVIASPACKDMTMIVELNTTSHETHDIFMSHYHFGTNAKVCIVSDLRTRANIQAAFSITKRAAVGELFKVSKFTRVDAGTFDCVPDRANQLTSDSSGSIAGISKKYDNVLAAVRLTIHHICPQKYSLIAEGSVPLMNAGLTMKTLTRLKAELEVKIGVSLPATLKFDSSTIRGIAEQIYDIIYPVKMSEEAVSRVVDSAIAFALDLALQDGNLPFDESMPLMHAGLSSLGAVQLQETLARDLEEIAMTRPIPATIAFDYPSVNAIKSFIIGSIFTEAPNLEDSKNSICEPGGIRPPTGIDKLDIICYIHGAECRAPGSQIEVLSDERLTLESLSVVPLSRWDLNFLCSKDIGQAPPNFGGMLPNISTFDTYLAGMGDAEAVSLDPQQRLILASTISLWNMASTAFRCQNSKYWATFVGMSRVEYPVTLQINSSELGPYYATGSHLSVTAGRVAFVLGLGGAASAIDTACSSSLVACMFARSWTLNDMNLIDKFSRTQPCAFACGINLTLCVLWSLACNAARMVSRDGRCKTFDRAADGYVRSEASGVLHLCGNALNVCTHDVSSPQRGIQIIAISSNQDGRSSALTAPNGPAQQDAIRSCLLICGVDPLQFSTLQTHGTGTALGDPIEVNAAVAAFYCDSPARIRPLELAARKCISGHAEPAAGILGQFAAMNELNLLWRLPLTQLRGPSTHVTTALKLTLSKTMGSLISLSKQLAEHAENSGYSSVSAFAFQGTNANSSLMAADNLLSKCQDVYNILLNQKSHWRQPCCHVWLKRCITNDVRQRSSILYHMQMSPEIARLKDHVVYGRILCPVAAYIETAISILSKQNRNSHSATVCHSTIPCPMILSHADEKFRTTNVYVCYKTGRIQIESSNHGASTHSHLDCTVHDTPVAAVVSCDDILKHMTKWDDNICTNVPLCAVITRANFTTSQPESTIMDPGSLDSLIHLPEGTGAQFRDRMARIPVAIKAFRISQRSTYPYFAWCSASNYEAGKSADNHHGTLGVRIFQLRVTQPRMRKDAYGKLPSRLSQCMNHSVYAIDRLTRPSKFAKYTATPSTFRVCPDIFTRKLPHRNTLAFLALTVSNDSTFELVATGESGEVLHGTARSLWHEYRSGFSLHVDSNAVQLDTRHALSSDPLLRETCSHGSIHLAALMRLNMMHRENAKTSLNAAIKNVIMYPKFFDRCRLIKTSKTITTSVGIIFGGLGKLGESVSAQLFVNASISFATLVGRTGRSKSLSPSLNHMSAIRADMTLSSEANRPVKNVRLLGNITVFNLCGALADALSAQQCPGRVRPIFAPKARSSFLVFRELHAWRLSSHCAFSSLTALMGNAGQTSYAAANAALDADAEYRRNGGMPYMSIQWGAWSGGGMASGLEDRMIRVGMGLINEKEGLHTMQNIVDGVFGRRATVSVSAFNWKRYKLAHKRAGGSRFLRNFKIDCSDHIQDSESRCLRQPKAKPKSDKLPVQQTNSEYDIARIVQKAVSSILGHSISSSAPLMDAGFDSLSSTEFTAMLAQLIRSDGPVAIELPFTLIFDYPTQDAIIEFLSSKCSIEHNTRSAVPETPRPNAANVERIPSKLDVDPEQMSILSVVQEFATSAFAKTDKVVRLPLSRWDIEICIRPCVTFGGFICDPASFDNEIFSISCSESVAIDPQQRLLLNCCAMSLQKLPGKRICQQNNNEVGVVIGMSTTDYNKIVNDIGMSDAASAATGSAFLSVAAGRISFVLNTKGPALSIDTACSSGLVALHTATQTLVINSGQVRECFVAGVNLVLHWSTSAMFTSAGMLANDGRCKALDSRADGYVRSEACVVLFIGSSHSDGDSQTLFGWSAALVGSSAINQDGRSSSLTAPSGPSQKLAIQAALANIQCKHHTHSSICSLQMHGTGTALGDPIEVGAICAFMKSDLKCSLLILGATKTSIAHTEPSAGLVSVSVAVTEQICKSSNNGLPHMNHVNPHISSVLKVTPVKSSINRQIAPAVPLNGCKHADSTLSIGCNAFAFQGTNAHAILIQWPHVEVELQMDEPHIPAWHAFRYWVVPLPHRILVHVTVSPCKFACFAAGLESMTWMKDHIVRGRPILPGAGALEMAQASACFACENTMSLIAVGRVSFSSPLELAKLWFEVKLDLGIGLVRIGSPVSGMTIIGRILTNTINRGNNGARSESQEEFFSPFLSCFPTYVHTPHESCAVENNIFSRVCCSTNDGLLVCPAALDATFQSISAIWEAQSRKELESLELRVPTAFTTYVCETTIQKPTLSFARSQAHMDIHGAEISDHVIFNRCDVRDMVSRPLFRDNGHYTSKLAPSALVEEGRATTSTHYFAKAHSIFHLNLCDASHLLCMLQAPMDSVRRIVSSDEYLLGALRSIALELSHLQLHEDLGPRITCELSTVVVGYPDMHEDADYSRVDIVQSMNIWRCTNKRSCALFRRRPIVVFGGTGALGQVITNHAAINWENSEIILHSRVGRTTANVFRGACLIIITAADIGVTSFSESWCPQRIQNPIIVHASGVLRDATATNADVMSITAVLASKCAHQANSHHSTYNAIHVSCLFSSIAALLGSPGQAGYAAANARLDETARYCAQAGLPVCSVQWGPWEAMGMAAMDSVHVQRLSKKGLESLQPHEGMQFFEALVALFETSQGGHAIVASVSRTDWHKYTAAMPMARGSAISFLQNFVDLPTKTQTISNHHSPLEIAHSTKTSPHLTPHLSFNLATITEHVTSIVQQVVGRSFPIYMPFMEAGFDSLASVELVSNLSNTFSVKLAATVIFDYPSIQALANYVCGLLQPSTTSQYQIQAKSMTTPQVSRIEQCDILVQIKSLSLSGDDSCLATIYQHDRPDKVPISRWDVEKVDSINIMSAFAAFISSPEAFDPELFHISVLEASVTDPQQRLMLTSTIKLVSPNVPSEVESTSRRGVYVGLASYDYSVLAASARHQGTHETSAFGATAFFGSVTPGRTSYVFGLTGPSIAFDTACSSSLVAVKSAIMDLKSSTCTEKVGSLENLRGALVGGVNVMLTSFVTETFECAGMLSADGRCKTLAEDADGYVRGEACIALLLNNILELHDGISSIPVIASAAVNQDGRSSSLTAPNGHSQRRVIHLALFLAEEDLVSHLHTTHILEMHGTGTPLGDPVEIGASQSVFKNSISLVTAVKTTVGHCEPAAGMFGLICITEKVLDLHIGKVGMLHLRAMNQHVVEATHECVSFRGSRELAAISQVTTTGVLKAGVSAFAFQGTNAHVRCFLEAIRIITRSNLHEMTVVSSNVIWTTPVRRACILSSSVCIANGLSVAKFIALQLFSNRTLHASQYLDHVIAGHNLFPGSGFLDLAYNAVAAALIKISNGPGIYAAVIPAPLQIYGRTQNMLTVSVHLTNGEIRIQSLTATHLAAHTQYIRVDYTAPCKSRYISGPSREALRSFNTEPIDPSFAYQCMVHIGLQYGPSFRLMCSIWYSGKKGGGISIIRTLNSKLCAMPPIVDSSMQLAAPPIGISKSLRVPAAIGGYLQTGMQKIRTKFIEGFAVALTFGEHVITADHATTDHVVSSESGQEISKLFELQSKSVSSRLMKCENETKRPVSGMIYSLHLRAAPVSNRVIYRTQSSLCMQNSSVRACLAAAAAAQVVDRDALRFNLPGYKWHGITGSCIGSLLQCVEQERLMSYSSNHDEIYINGTQMFTLLLPDQSERIKSCHEISSGTYFHAFFASELKPLVPTARKQIPSRSRTLIITGGTGAIGNAIISKARTKDTPDHILTGLSGRTGKMSFAKRYFKVTIVKHTNMAHEVSARMLTLPGSMIMKLDGVLRDLMLQSQTVCSFRAVFKPKMCIRDPLSDIMLKSLNAPSACILFSSIASLLGSKSQSNYAAANGNLDAIAEPCLKMGIECRVIQWGAWAGAGMASINSGRLERNGIRLISPKDGISSLWSVIDGGLSKLLPLGINIISLVDWPKILARQPQSSMLSVGKFSEIADLITPAVEPRSYLEKYKQLEGDYVRRPVCMVLAMSDEFNTKALPSETEISALLSEKVAMVLGKDEIDSDSPLMHIGLDSLSAVELRTMIGEEYGHSLPATLFFDYPTVASAASYITSLLCNSKFDNAPLRQMSGSSGLKKSPSSRASIATTSREPTDSHDSVSQIPIERWDIERYSTFNDNPAACIRFGSFVSLERLIGVDCAFLCVGPGLEAVHLDPRQRLLVIDVASAKKAAETSAQYHALHAGLAGKDHALLLQEWGHKESAYTGIGVESSVPVGRASFLLNLGGPATSIDTACSSSLVAANFSLDFTRKNQANAAFTVGVSLMLTIDMHRKLGCAGMLSSSGRCRTLDASADGYARGEACHTLLILTSNMEILFVSLSGSAVNQDGRSSSLTAPNGPSQQGVIRTAMDDFSFFEKTPIGSCSLLQMHGTGTPLGDPIEVGAASEVLKVLPANTNFEASKSWKAHGEPAAGALSLCELTFNLSKYVICGQCHLRMLNPHIIETFRHHHNSSAGFPVMARQLSCTTSTVCQGGASAFAFQGTNAHVVAKTMNTRCSYYAKYRNSELLLHHQRAWPGTCSVASQCACISAIPSNTSTSSTVSVIVASFKSTDSLNVLHAAFTAFRALYEINFFALMANTFVSSNYHLTNNITIEIGCNDGSAYLFRSTGSLAFRGAGSRLNQSRTCANYSSNVATLKVLFLDSYFSKHFGYCVLCIILHGDLSSALDILEVHAIKHLQLASVGAFAAWKEFAGGVSTGAVVTEKFTCIRNAANCIETHFVINKGSDGQVGITSSTFGYILEWQFSCADPELSIVPVNNSFSSSEPHHKESVKSTASVIATLQQRELAGSIGCRPNAIVRDLGGTVSGLLRAVCSETKAHISVQTGSNASPKLLPLHTKGSIRAQNSIQMVEIVGGLGALGMLIAYWLITQPVLSSLRLSNLAGRNNAFENMTKHPAIVCAKSFDVSMRECWNTITLHDTLFGCSGLLRDASIHGQAVGTVRCVFASKYVMSYCMDDLLPVKFKCQYSSLASLLGSPAQANYCSANARIDRAAARDRVSGRPSLSIQWGPWIGVGGMAHENTLRKLEHNGVHGVTKSEGIHILGMVLSNCSATYTTITANRFHWPRFFRSQANAGPFVAEFGSPSISTCKSEVIKDVDLSLTSCARESFDPVACVTDKISRLVSDIVVRSVPFEEPLMDYGLDSLGILELQSALTVTFDHIQFPSIIIFDHPSISSIAAFIMNHNRRTMVDSKCAEVSPSTKNCTNRAAVVSGDGSSMVLNRLSTAQDCCFSIPSIRWDLDFEASKPAQQTPNNFGNIIDNINCFDTKVYGVKLSEARQMDPQQRLLLDATLASTLSKDIVPATVAVVIGIQHMEYAQLYCNRSTSAGLSPYAATGSALSVASGRVSYVFNYGQPAMSVDTACSASLLAIHICIYARLSEGCRGLSIAGGVNLTLSAINTATINAAGMLSMDSRCKALDSLADGYGRGEAAGVFLLAHFPVEQKWSDSSKMLFNFESTAANQDGRSGSLTAPNGMSQRQVIHTAVSRAVNIDSLMDFSVHGTGTILGDPIEISAIGAVLISTPPIKQPSMSRLVASKTVLGHTEAAAGLAALMQVSESACFRLLVPLMHLRNVNPYVAAECHNTCLPRNTMHASCGAVGVSAFAFMGSNVHVIILSEYLGPDVTKRSHILPWDRTHAWKEEGPNDITCFTAPRARFNSFRMCFECKLLSKTRLLNQSQIIIYDVLCAATNLIICTDKNNCGNTSLNNVIVVTHFLEVDLTSFEVDTISGSVIIDRSIKCQAHHYTRFPCAEHFLSACFIGCTDMNISAASIVPTKKPTSVVCNKSYAIQALMHIDSVAYSSLVAVDAFTDRNILRNNKESYTSTASNDNRVHLECMGAVVTGGVLKHIAYVQGCDAVGSNSCHDCCSEKPVIPFTPSRTSAEVLEIVLNAVAEISGKSILQDESLFDAGIDSIATVELVLTLQEICGIKALDVANIASCQTPMALSESLCTAIENNKCTHKCKSEHVQSEQTPRFTNQELTNHDELKVLFQSMTTPETLFLGAPAFGDGQLAYIRLVSSLPLGVHAVLTLERDACAEPWPTLAAGHAQQIAHHELNAVDVNIPTALGGHSLGGVLAMETASWLETKFSRKTLTILFDAPHPMQFKPDWNTNPEDCDANTAVLSTGLTYMGIALQSFHCDLVKCGWFDLSRQEKYSLFEDVVFQALGRDVCAKEMDEQISAGPFSAQWNSGIIRDEKNNACDVSAWKVLRGTFDSVENSTKKSFKKIQGKVICYKAGRESSALFETELFLKDGSKVLESMTGYSWVLTCDHVEIMHCQGSHMDLITSESDCSGDLSLTITPHVTQELSRAWADLTRPCDATPLRNKRARNSPEAWGETVFIKEATLPLWRARCVMSHKLPCNRTPFSVCMDAHERLFMLGLNYFLCRGLLEIIGETQKGTEFTAVVFIQDLLSRMAEWSQPAFRARLPCLACHQKEMHNKNSHLCDEIRACEVLNMVLDVVTNKCKQGCELTSNLRIIFVALPETTAARIAFHVANLCRCAGGNAYAFVAQHRPGAVLSDDARDSIRRQKSFDEKINSLDPTSLQPAIQCLATRYLEAETKLYIPSKGFARSLRHLRNTSGDFMKVSLVLRPTLKTRSEWTMAVCTGIISAAAAWDSAMKDLHLPMVSSHVTMMFDI
jgi:acyl transferase domain-containing protein/acyl carrier protein